MVLGNKHFDDLDDDFSDFDEKLESSGESEGSAASCPSPLAWRKVLIEKAVINVRKAYDNKADLNATYPSGTLVFDDEAHKFARVIESRPGFLNATFIGGGKLVKQNIDKLDFVRQNRAKLTLQEMAKKLSITEVQVIGILNQIELENEKVTTKSAPSSRPVISAAKQKPSKKPNISVVAPLASKTSPSNSIKIAAKKPTSLKKAKLNLASVSKESSISFTQLLPKGATTDPVRDPNGYIQQNFLLMSNKELANATGLSEHTIRRKLGEWGLKRKDFVNKA
ncbi:MAG: hypothetical protein KC505_10485 [Myxococcales bacterium]|nr:hypothetical protein [Myxococcales bacterium]USN50399.1 MAG: hypothetical protein H6731_09065 [Myxococcales bacterium]